MSRDVLDKKSWPEATSTAGPAAAQLPGGRPVLAWRGDHNSRNLTLAVIDGPPGSIGASTLARYSCSDASDHAPALCYHQGLRLAWAGINGAHTVNLATIDLPFGGNQVHFDQRAFANAGDLGSGASGPPSLAVDAIDALDLLCLNADGRLCSALTFDGTNFDSGNEVFFKPQCVEGAAQIRSPYDHTVTYVAWTQAGDNRLNFVRVDGVSMHTPVPSAQSSLHAPSLAVHNGTIYIAWVGTDGDAHLNVAPVDTGAIDGGSEPINSNQVDTLNELSLAAPALLTLPPTEIDRFNTLPERLAIFWTGVDGAGTISGAIVYQE